jgi:alpha-tubulin suppressor-like RCC1 family protein
MKPIPHLIRRRILTAFILAAVGLISSAASAGTVNAIYNSAADVPVTANGYTATGNTVNFTLNYAPATGTDLMVVSNTALGFIAGTFSNLAQGQAVALNYGGVTYRFVANYYGGNGNDLVLVWGSNRAFGWGFNDYGQLGDDTSGTNRLVPVPVEAAGVLAGKTLLTLAANNVHSLALCSDGAVAAWGGNDDGELGNNSTNSSLVPVAVNTASGVSALYGRTVIAVAAGGGHSLALCSDGSVAAWGWNPDGQVGDNSTTDSYVPVAVNKAQGVSALYGKTVVAIAAGYWHSLALCSDGTVAAWGFNLWGQLGDDTTTDRLMPVAVNTNLDSALYHKTVIAVAAGYAHSLALCSDGTVAAWGYNFNGQLGDNTTNDSHVPLAVNTSAGTSVLSGKTVAAIAAGSYQSLALCSDGTVAAWGDNSSGQLGDDTTTDRYVPVAVNTAPGMSALYGKTVVAVEAGVLHSLALCSDGTLAAWGDNSFGELGDSTTTPQSVPVAVDTSPLASSQRVVHAFSSSGAWHSLAIVSAPPCSPITVTGASKPTRGGFQFAFANTPGAFFGVLAATNPALPVSNWTPLDGLTEVTPGQFQFTDPQATNTPRRFYRVRSP